MYVIPSSGTYVNTRGELSQSRETYIWYTLFSKVIDISQAFGWLPHEWNPSSVFPCDLMTCTQFSA
jgi:hypothetical protein